MTQLKPNELLSQSTSPKDNSTTAKKYFVKITPQQQSITFNNPFSPPKTPKQVLPLIKTSLTPPKKIASKTPPDNIKNIKFCSSIFKKQETKQLSNISLKDNETIKQKEESLRSTDGTTNMIHEFQSVLRSVNRRSNPQIVEIKQNKTWTNGNKHQRTFSQTRGTQQQTNQFKKQSYIEVGQSKKSNKFKDFLKAQPFSDAMQQTLLQFKSVLGNSIIMQKQSTPKNGNKQQVQELTQEIHNLRLLIKERQKAWEDKMVETLKKQKTIIVQSFKHMLNQLKKMCEWQRFGDNSASQPVLTSSKKLFNGEPFQHQFKSSMQQIRNTLMQLKILNSESQTLRQQLQNLRRTLQQERQIRYSIQEQLQQIRDTNKRLQKWDSQQKQKEIEYIDKINLLLAQSKILKQHSPVVSYIESQNQGVDIVIISEKNNSRTVAQTILELEDKVKSISQQNNSLRQEIERLTHQLVHSQNQYARQINTLRQRMKAQILNLRNSCVSKFPTHNNKVFIHVQDRNLPIKFKPAKRKVSTSQSLPEHSDIRQQIEAILYS